jgi:hypothetical protein
MVHFDGNARYFGAQAGNGGVAFVAVAPNEDQPRAKCAEPPSGLKPDPASGACDDAGFSSHALYATAAPQLPDTADAKH